MTVLAMLAAFVAAAAFAALWWRERRRRSALRDQLLFERRRADSAVAATDSAVAAADSFFDVVSHELRSPLAAIIGYQELLDDGAYGQLGDGAAEPVQRIGRSAQHLLHLIDGVLDLARIRAGAVAPALEPVELDDFLARIASDFRTQAEERSLRHLVHLETGMPTIRSDRHRIARALHLLIVAAVRNPAGERLEMRAHGGDHGLTVHLRGARIPLQEDARDPALRTGVRLAIARATARLLGGDLTIEGPDGSTAAELTLRIPAAPPSAPGP